MIKSDPELRTAIAKINDLIQDCHNYIGDDNDDKYDSKDFLIRFPRGYITRVTDLRKDYAFIDDLTLQKNISYSLMLTDLFNWLINRTDIYGTVTEMIIKNCITIMGSICETLAKKYTPSSKETYNKRIEYLRNNETIEESLYDDLKWLWEKRQNIHLHLIDSPEYNKYSCKDYNKSIDTTRSFINSLKIKNS